MGQQATELRRIGMSLIMDGRELPLLPGRRYLIGRSPECQIVLDDRTVSRRHARVLVTDEVVIEDLGSSNGVYVDGIRVDTERPVRAGQSVQIGSFEFVLGDRAAERNRRTAPTRRDTAPTLTELRSESSPASHSGATDRANYFDVLAALSQKLLSSGQPEEAERVICGHLDTLLEQSRTPGTVEPAFAERAASHALRLAEASGKAVWVDYVFELYTALDALMPERLVDDCYRVAHVVRRPSLDVLTGYVDRMEAVDHEHPTERFRVRRLRGLCCMLASV